MSADYLPKLRVNKEIMYPEAMQVLHAYGIQIPQTRLAPIDEDECVKLSDEIGYPVVLKIASPDIVHKVM